MNPSPAIGNTKSGKHVGEDVLWGVGTSETLYYSHKTYASNLIRTGLISAITAIATKLLDSCLVLLSRKRNYRGAGCRMALDRQNLQTCQNY